VDPRGAAMCLGSLLILVVILSASPGAADKAPTALRGAGAQIDQVLVFDAGSSGTRIHVFNIAPAGDPTKAHVPRIDLSVRPEQTYKVKPGLSSFAEREDLPGVQKNIEELVKFADNFVPKDRRATTPTLLKATAGLRSVPQFKAQAVLQRIRETLSATGYRVEPEWVDIIKGKEEGGLAWVAANYLQGTFGEEGGGAAGKSVGVIEMGGGSTQVTFEVPASVQLATDDEFVFETALGRRYRLYAHSYLGYGQDHAQTSLASSLPGAAGEDPCYPRGYVRRTAAGAAGAAGGGVVSGAGNATDCMAQIEARLLAATARSAPGRYAEEVPLAGTFVATENFFYSQADKKLGLQDRDVQQGAFEAGAETVCAAVLTPTEEERAAMEKGTASAVEPKHCFALAYQAMLLKALKVPAPAVPVRVVRQIRGGDVDWALGAALIHHLQGHAARQVGLPAWVPVVLLLLGVPLVMRMAWGHACARKAVEQVTGIKPSKIGANPAE